MHRSAAAAATAAVVVVVVVLHIAACHPPPGGTPAPPAPDDHASVCDRPVIVPVQCDFGDVDVGAVGGCTVNVENDCDTHDLVITAATVADGGAPTFRVVPTSLPVTLATGDSTDLLVHFVPDAAGAAASALHLVTSFGDADVALTGNGALSPLSCTVRVASVNGVPAASAPQVATLDDVTVAVDASNDVTGVTWSIASRPANGTVQLDDPNGESTGVVVDAAGTWRVCADVADDAGQLASCCADIAVLAGSDFSVQLSSDDATVALHMVKASDDGSFCVSTSTAPPANAVSSSLGGSPACASAALDCFHDTCRAGGAEHVEWDGIAGRTAGDPSMPATTGESIGAPALPAGRYLLVVDGAAGAQASARLFLDGALASAASIVLDDASYTELALVVSDGVAPPCLDDLTDGTDACP